MFLLHTTGSNYPYHNSIRVDCLDNEYGAISAHTCAGVICFPRGVFVDTSESFNNFVMSIEASDLNFNTV